MLQYLPPSHPRVPILRLRHQHEQHDISIQQSTSDDVDDPHDLDSRRCGIWDPRSINYKKKYPICNVHLDHGQQRIHSQIKSTTPDPDPSLQYAKFMTNNSNRAIPINNKTIAILYFTANENPRHIPGMFDVTRIYQRIYRQYAPITSETPNLLLSNDFFRSNIP